MASSNNPARPAEKIEAYTDENVDYEHIRRLYDDEYFTRLEFRYPDVFYSCDICGDSLLIHRKAFMERKDYNTYDICLDCMIRIMPALHDIICDEETNKLTRRTTTRHRNPDYVLLYPKFTESNWKSSIPYNTVIRLLQQEDNHGLRISQDEYCSICMHSSILVVVLETFNICPLCIKRLNLYIEEEDEREEEEDD